MITGNGRADADNPKIIQQMQEKHPLECWPHASWPIGEEPDLTSNIAAVVKNTKPLTGVGPRGLSAGPIKQLFTAQLSEKGSEAKQRLTELGQVYFSCEMPTWLRKALNGGLLTLMQLLRIHHVLVVRLLCSRTGGTGRDAVGTKQ